MRTGYTFDETSAGSTAITEVPALDIEQAKLTGQKALISPEAPPMFLKVHYVYPRSLDAQSEDEGSRYRELEDKVNKLSESFDKVNTKIKPPEQNTSEPDQAGQQTLPDWLKECLERIERLSELENDWDSYGASPPNPEICSSLKALLFKIRDLPVKSLFIAPLPDGSVNLELETAKRELEIELYDPAATWAICLQVEKEPVEDLRERFIRLDTQFREMVVWALERELNFKSVA